MNRWPHLRAFDEERPALEVLLEEWRCLRAEGVPAGSSARPVAALRAELLRLGAWEEVYRIDFAHRPADVWRHSREPL